MSNSQSFSATGPSSTLPNYGEDRFGEVCILNNKMCSCTFFTNRLKSILEVGKDKSEVAEDKAARFQEIDLIWHNIASDMLRTFQFINMVGEGCVCV